MTHRRPRKLTDADVARLMAALRVCRDACIDFHRAAPILGPHYRAASAITAAIDGFAEVATGSRDHFHGRICEAGPGTPERKTPGAE